MKSWMWESFSYFVSRSHSSATVMWTFIFYLSPFTWKIATRPYSFFSPIFFYLYLACSSVAWVYHHVSDLSSVDKNCFQLCWCWQCCREYWLLTFSFRMRGPYQREIFSLLSVHNNFPVSASIIMATILNLTYSNQKITITFELGLSVCSYLDCSWAKHSKRFFSL